MPEITLLPYDIKKHRPQVARLLTNSELMHGWGMDPLKGHEINGWIGESTRLVLMVQDLHTKDIVGMVNFYDIDRENNIADWGVVIDPYFTGKGYAQAAGKASIAYGFNTLGLQAIELYIECYNLVSQHIHEKLGYVRERQDEKKRFIYKMERPVSS